MMFNNSKSLSSLNIRSPCMGKFLGTSRLSSLHPQKRLNTRALSRSEFKLRTRDLSGDPLLGLFLCSGSPFIAELIAATGLYDFLVVDCQHSPLAPGSLSAMLTAIDAAKNNTPSVVRVQGPYDRGNIQQALDAGAYAILVPTVKTVEDAQMVVDATFFPPLGNRSTAFPIRPSVGRETVADFVKEANSEVTLMLQVETRECINNLEDILSVRGVDCAFIGPFDLTSSTGLAEKYGSQVEAFESSEFKDMCERVVGMSRRLGIGAGNFGVVEDKVRIFLSHGFNVVGTGTDLGVLEGAVGRHSHSMQQQQQQTKL